MNQYYTNLKLAMEMLAENGAVFIGQAVAEKGTGMSVTFVFLSAYIRASISS